MTRNNFLEPDWPAPVNVHAACSTRQGGLSKAPFDSLNLAMHVGDDAEKVQQNRDLMYKALALPRPPLWLQQIHSNIVVDAAEATMNTRADACFSHRSGVVCAVMTADCLPVLLCDRQGQTIAAIHAGWRGILAGVIGNTVNAMAKENLMAWLGPAIGADCFQVGDDVRDAFVQQMPDYQSAFKAQKPGKWLADIYLLAKIQLAALGVTHVYGGNFCTFSESDRFYSYRRNKRTGRMTTLIWRD